MIHINNLSVQVDAFRIDDISLKVDQKDYFVLLGPSGAGKTVLVETLLGLHKPGKGRILIDGCDVTHLPPEERRIGYIPQDFGLFPHLGVRDNILFGIRNQGLLTGKWAPRMGKLCDLLDINRLLERSDIGSLSGGERQRVAIARAMLVEPKALIIDEPFSSIDEYLKIQLQKNLLQIKESKLTTILHVTHDHHEAFIMADRIGVFLGGKLHQTDEPRDLYLRPQTIEVARFLLTRNIYRGIAIEVAPDRSEARVKIGDILLRTHLCRPVEAGKPVFVGIRPEDVKIDVLPKDWKVYPHEGVYTPKKPWTAHVFRGCDESDCNAVTGIVIKRRERFSCHQYEVAVDALDPPLEVEVMKSRLCGPELDEGMHVKICLSRKSLWALPQSSL